MVKMHFQMLLNVEEKKLRIALCCHLADFFAIYKSSPFYQPFSDESASAGTRQSSSVTSY